MVESITKKDLANGLTKLEDNLGRIMAKGFAGVDKRFEQIDKKFDLRFNKVDERFNKVDKRLERIENKLDNVVYKADFDKLVERVKNLEEALFVKKAIA